MSKIQTQNSALGSSRDQDVQSMESNGISSKFTQEKPFFYGVKQFHPPRLKRSEFEPWKLQIKKNSVLNCIKVDSTWFHFLFWELFKTKIITNIIRKQKIDQI